MKKILLLCVLAFAVRAYGQTQEKVVELPPLEVQMTPTTGSKLPDTLPGVRVVIESWHYDPAQKTVTLHLVNRSNKDATAWNISIAERYADGSTDYVDGRPNSIGDHQVMEDMLGAVIQRQLMKAEGRVGHGVAWSGPAGQKPPTMPGIAEGNGTFAAGTSHDYVIPEAKDIADIEAVVDVVAYADGTADVQNERAFRNLVAVRKGPLMAMEKTTEVIKRVLVDPMVSSPIAEVLRELTPLADADQAKNRPQEDPEWHQAFNLRSDVRNLEMVRSKILPTLRMTESEWLTRYAEGQEKRIAVMKPHCELVPNK